MNLITTLVLWRIFGWIFGGRSSTSVFGGGCKFGSTRRGMHGIGASGVGSTSFSDSARDCKFRLGIVWCELSWLTSARNE